MTVNRWHLAMITLPVPNSSDPVACADYHTSMCDLRIAVCIAKGVPVDEIDPASGYDLSRAAYERVRASWRAEAKQRAACGQGASEWFDRNLAEVFAGWSARRPQFTAGDDWLAGVHKPTDTIGAV